MNITLLIKCNKLNLDDLIETYGMDFLLLHFGKSFLTIKEEIEKGMNPILNDRTIWKYDIYLAKQGLLKKL